MKAFCGFKTYSISNEILKKKLQKKSNDVAPKYGLKYLFFTHKLYFLYLLWQSGSVILF